MADGRSGEDAEALWYVAPGRAELRREAVPAPGSGEVLVRALHGAISRGTERLVLAGRVPPSEYARMRGPHTRRLSAPSDTSATSSTIFTDSAMPYGVSKRSSSSTRRSSACSVPVVMIVATQVRATREKRQVVAPSTRGSRSAGIAT